MKKLGHKGAERLAPHLIATWEQRTEFRFLVDRQGTEEALNKSRISGNNGVSGIKRNNYTFGYPSVPSRNIL